jgi:hypothetical protein
MPPKIQSHPAAVFRGRKSSSSIAARLIPVKPRPGILLAHRSFTPPLESFDDWRSARRSLRRSHRLLSSISVLLEKFGYTGQKNTEAGRLRFLEV